MPKPKDPHRKFLPTRRRNETWHAKVDGNGLYFTVGFKEDGTPGELFIDVSRYGAAIRDWMSQTAQMFSLHLQRDMPLECLVDFYCYTRSEPCGRVDHDDSWGFRIETCTSIMDLIVRTMAVAYLGRKDLATVASVPTWKRQEEESPAQSTLSTSMLSSDTPDTTSDGQEETTSPSESTDTEEDEGQGYSKFSITLASDGVS